MSDWLTTLAELDRHNQSSVLVTVADTKGSTPREAGTKMVITQDNCHGTIGGGNLEFKAIAIARKMLADDILRAALQRFPLGPSLGQCCGGVAMLLFERIDNQSTVWIQTLLRLRREHRPAVLVSQTAVGAEEKCKLIVSANACYGDLGIDSPQIAVVTAHSVLNATTGAQLGPANLLFEPIRASDFHIVLFGAGHVGRELVRVMHGLPCTVNWVDSREHEFPDQVPANVTIELSDEPDYEIDDAPPDSYILIMTHSHPLDQRICERALHRNDWAYCGLIGSATKLNKFRKRMLAQGLSGEALAKLTCPIGIDGITGKHPSEIAIAVAAQLLQVRSNRATSLAARTQSVA